MPLSKSTLKHAIGMALAGALAFGAVALANRLAPTPEPPGTTQGDTNDSSVDQESEPYDAKSNTAKLVGKWRAPVPANQAAFVEFSNLGIWVATDGCNGMSGTWRIDPDGYFVTSMGGVMTQIGCDNVDLPQAVTSATTVTIRGDELVLTTHDGEETGLVRASDTGFELDADWHQQGDAAATVTFNDDGTWRSETGCETLTGTWRIGDSREEQYVELSPETGALKNAFLTTPVLSLGNGSAELTGTRCPNERELGLEHSTDYSFFPSLDGRSFRVAEVAPPGADTRVMEFKRDSIAASAAKG